DNLLLIPGITSHWTTAAPAASQSASASFYNISQTLFDSLEFTIRAPTVISGDPRVVDQYNQYYAAYMAMFSAYETEIIGLNTAALIGTVVGKQTTGGGVLSVADYSANIAGLGGTKNNDPLLSTIVPLLTPPVAPTTSSAYENLTLASGLGT